MALPGDSKREIAPRALRLTTHRCKTVDFDPPGFNGRSARISDDSPPPRDFANPLLVGGFTTASGRFPHRTSSFARRKDRLGDPIFSPDRRRTYMPTGVEPSRKPKRKP